jgi:hypothetical protein
MLKIQYKISMKISIMSYNKVKASSCLVITMIVRTVCKYIIAKNTTFFN